jgi:hypothetical protein
MSKVANKLQKSIQNEKQAVQNKPLAVTDNIVDQYNKADEFFAVMQNSNSKAIKVSEGRKKQPLITSTFSLPEDEYTSITNVLKLFAQNNKFIKQTEVFRIALAAMKSLPDSEILEIYDLLPKVSGRNR